VGPPRCFILSIVASAAVVASFPRTARADASAHLVYLRGPGAEQCPGEAAIRAAVSSRLGYDPFFPWAHDTLFAEIDRSNDAFRAVVKLVDANNLQRGSRELSVRGSDCSAVIDVLALTISLTIDPSSVVGGPKADEPPPAEAPPPSQSTVSPAAASQPTIAPEPEGPPAVPDPWLRRPEPNERPGTRPRQANPVSWQMALGTLAAVDAAPAPNAGFTLSVGATWRIFSFDLEARADLPSQGASMVAAMEVRSWLVAGSLVPCAHFAFVFGCPVVSVGAVGATARGIQLPRDDYGPWWALGARAGAEWSPIRQVTLRAYAELLGTMLPVDVFVDGRLIYGFARETADLGAVVVWRFL
jgi:hypothetical protein